MCTLVQIHTVPPEEMFEEYAYFSSFADTVVENARVISTRLVAERSLGADDLAMEIASNDGYLLRNYVEAGVPVLGVDPARNIAAVAEENGVATVCEFFGTAARRAAAGRGPARRAAREQRARPRSRRERRRRRDRHDPRRRRRRGHRDPVRARPGRRARVRHDLPRAPVLLLGDGARCAVRSPRPVPQPRSTAPDPRWIAPPDGRTASGGRGTPCGLTWRQRRRPA